MMKKILMATVAMMMVTAAMAQKHESVDLGLPSGTLWATCNIGAATPEDYGDYFAWGETKGFKSGKTNFTWSTYKWCTDQWDQQTKYCTESDYGTVDNLKELTPEDDAAHANWGKEWRMPTYDQQTELREKCTWTWTTLNGVEGYEVKGPNGNVIFLPAAGCRDDEDLDGTGRDGRYWSTTLDTNYPYRADYLFFNSDKIAWEDDSRCYGRSIRPVRAK